MLRFVYASKKHPLLLGPDYPELLRLIVSQFRLTTTKGPCTTIQSTCSLDRSPCLRRGYVHRIASDPRTSLLTRFLFKTLFTPPHPPPRVLPSSFKPLVHPFVLVETVGNLNSPIPHPVLLLRSSLRAPHPHRF